MKKIIATLLFLFLAFPAFGAEFDLILQWDENTEPDLATGEKARYKIYMRVGESMAGLKTNATEPVINVRVADDENADPLIVQKTTADLDDTKQYFIAVTALDGWGNESGLSNEVSTDNSGPANPGGCRVISIVNNGGTVNIQ